MEKETKQPESESKNFSLEKEESKVMWLVLDSPIGESDEAEEWPENKKYWIRREVTVTGVIIWHGLKTNWIKSPDGQWTVLKIEDEEEYNEDEVEEADIPTGTLVCKQHYETEFNFVFSNEPVYEKIYQKELKEKENE